MKKKMLINVADAEESRVAIVEDGLLEEFTIETASKEQIKGNIYNGIIVKVEPSLQAAFVDYGGNRHGFLPMGEIHESWYTGDAASGDRERRPRIQDALRRNNKVLVQVVKEELGNKGASLSTYISLPGRYLVLMPSSDSAGGISRKIEDEEERKKLKETIAQLNPPPDIGIIVRTAGLNRNKTELQRDLTYLQRLWASVQEKSQQSDSPALIYQEQDLVIRSIRDYFTPDIQEVSVDNRDVYRRARDFFQAVMPRYQGRVKLYRDRKPLFAKYQLEEQIEAIYTHKVELKSGGSIVIDPTEALVAIDVNSGRATKEKGIEETAFKTNMEAAQEVARQLRLRDLGGLIVIDFIDMRNLKHIQEIEKALRQAVKRDKARTQVARISQFGLLELSRQRLKPTILEGNYLTCPHCEGNGLVKSKISHSLTVLRRIRTEAAKDTVETVKAALPFEVATYLLNQKRKEIAQLEDEYNLTIHLEGDPTVRAHEYRLEFVRREAPPTAVAARERSRETSLSRDQDKERERSRETSLLREQDKERERSRETSLLREQDKEKVVVTTPVDPTPTRRRREPLRERKPQPVVAVPDTTPVVAATSNGESTPVMAMARGRVFWRLAATPHNLALAQAMGTQPGGANGGRSGRGSSGRLTRRARSWWRRRSPSSPAANVENTPEAPTANENLS